MPNAGAGAGAGTGSGFGGFTGFGPGAAKSAATTSPFGATTGLFGASSSGSLLSGTDCETNIGIGLGTSTSQPQAGLFASNPLGKPLGTTPTPSLFGNPATGGSLFGSTLGQPPTGGLFNTQASSCPLPGAGTSQQSAGTGLGFGLGSIPSFGLGACAGTGFGCTSSQGTGLGLGLGFNGSAGNVTGGWGQFGPTAGCQPQGASLLNPGMQGNVPTLTPLSQLMPGQLVPLNALQTALPDTSQLRYTAPDYSDPHGIRSFYDSSADTLKVQPNYLMRGATGPTPYDEEDLLRSSASTYTKTWSYAPQVTNKRGEQTIQPARNGSFVSSRYRARNAGSMYAAQNKMQQVRDDFKTLTITQPSSKSSRQETTAHPRSSMQPRTEERNAITLQVMLTHDDQEAMVTLKVHKTYTIKDLKTFAVHRFQTKTKLKQIHRRNFVGQNLDSSLP